MGGFYLWRQKLLRKAINIQKSLGRNAYLTIVISGIAGVLCHGFFILSLTMAHKGGVSLLYESWPVIAVVATPFLMQKTWKDVSLKEFIVSIVSLIGVGIIILSDSGLGFGEKGAQALYEQTDYKALAGYILAFAGGYMCAVLVVTKAAYSERFSNLHDDIGTTFISEICSRTISMVLMLVIFLFLKEDLDFETIHWGASFYIGFVVFVVGGALYTYGLLKSDRPTIHIIYYFVPVLAVIWLWLAGETTINMYLFIGGGLVVLSNIYLALESRRTPLPPAL